MLVAMLTNHLKNGFFLSSAKEGYEYVLSHRGAVDHAGHPRAGQVVARPRLRLHRSRSTRRRRCSSPRSSASAAPPRSSVRSGGRRRRTRPRAERASEPGEPRHGAGRARSGVEAVRRRRRGRRPDPRRRRRGVPRAARPVGLRQVDRAADDRRPRGPDRGHHHHRRARRQRRRGQGPRHRDGVPELRALPAHDRAEEHRVPAAVAQGAGGRARPRWCRRPPRASTSATLLDRKPAQLSGGQRQRVALARAIVRRPQAFLMDEPLSNLDAKLRVQTRAELVELQRRLAATIIYVTHDQVEAMTMGHRIAVLDRRRAAAGRRAAGRLRRAGQPVRRPLHRQPAHEHGDRAPSTGSTARWSRSSPAGSVPVPAELAHRGRGRGRRRGGDRRAARGPALRRRPSGIPASVSVVESLGHERHVVCRLADQQLVIVRQDAHEPAPAEESTTFLVADRRRTARVRRRDRRADQRVSVTATRRRALARPPSVSAAASASLAYLLLIPSLLIFGVFVFWPLVHNVYLGFYRNPPFPGLPSTYVGFDQYRDVLTSETSSTASRSRSCSRSSPCPSASRSASASPCSRTSSCRASASTAPSSRRRWPRRWRWRR